MSMPAKDKKRLRDGGADLVKCIDVQGSLLLTELIKREAITEENKQTIQAEPTPFKQAEKVLDILQQFGGKDGRDKLIYSLRAVGQGIVAQTYLGEPSNPDKWEETTKGATADASSHSHIAGRGASETGKSHRDDRAILMTEAHQKIITSNLPELCKGLTSLRDVCDILVKREILMPNESEAIHVNERNPTTSDKARELLQLLFRKEDRAFYVLIEACDKCGNSAVANILRDGDSSGGSGSGSTRSSPCSQVASTSTASRKRQADDDDESGQSGASPKRAALEEIDREFFVDSGPMKVKVKNCEPDFYDNHRGKLYYKMDKMKSRGKVLIINVNNIKGYDKPRTGTDVDRDNLKQLFKQLSMKVTVKNDSDGLTAQDITNIVTEFAAEGNHEDSQCAVLVLLSHGENGYIYGTDAERVKIEKLRILLTECPSLKDKPKLTIIQACRDLTTEEEEEAERDASKRRDEIMCNPTQKGYTAWRTKTGSLYITALVRIFERYSYKLHVLDLLTQVQAAVWEDIQDDDEESAAAESRNSLVKDFFLFPTKGKFRESHR